MLRIFLQNHILANLTFVLVLAMGTLAYMDLPRQQDPTVNFNWVRIRTLLPGASATDVEQRVTDILEDAVDKVSDIKYVTSTSRQNVSEILVRFNELDDATFATRVIDLRREIQNRDDDLPVEAEQSEITEITNSSAFPTTMVLVVGHSQDENLRREAQRVREDLERLRPVDRVDAIGEQDPELQVLFDPDRLVGMGLSPSDLANTVAAHFRDVAAGTVELGDQKWLIRLLGTDSDPRYLSALPIVSARGEVPLGSVADVVRGREDPAQLVRYQDRPAVMLAVFKRGDANVLGLVEEINTYLATRNRLAGLTGVELVLMNDPTTITRSALGVMQSNALVGLVLVMVVTWLFLGVKMAFFTAIGIPFILAGVFWLLSLLGQTLNVIVLLGVVISLGMLVDDAVVVVEAIYYRMQRGVEGVRAVMEGLREVFAPVTTSVLTTISAFLPLMLLPGILGDFMGVTPLVIVTALTVSLIESFWMLPSHVLGARPRFNRAGRVQRWREGFSGWLRVRYVRLLVRAMRCPRLCLLAVVLLLGGAVAAVASGLVRSEFFASDLARQFYVNVEMPTGARLEKTLETTVQVEEVVRRHIRDEELRAMAAYAGIRFTDRDPLLGDHHGQISVNLTPATPGGRDVEQIIDAIRPDLDRIAGPLNVSFMRVFTGAPPTAKPISVKVRGNDPRILREAADHIIAILQNIEAVRDITDDDVEGRMELSVRLNADAVLRAGLNPATVIRDVRLLADGEVVASMQHQGERLEVRVRSRPEALQEIDSFLRHTIGLPDGSSVSLGQLLRYEVVRGKGNIRHYNLRRAITVEAELDKALMDTVTANRLIHDTWARDFAERFPGVDLDLTGELDDIQESVDAIGVMFLFGLGLIYLILGTQFRSYLQPLIVMATVPMAFIGVVLGLLVSDNPLSVYTLYGVVALAGISVNAAIVLISAANDRLAAGMSIQHAVIYAARRRVLPVIITSASTMAGLLSLAIGLGGRSLMWGPVAASIVWGLAVSTVLTLFVIPLLYRLVVRPPQAKALPLPPPLPGSYASLFERIRAPFRLGFSHGGAEERLALDVIAARQDLHRLYDQARRALDERDYQSAIRLFEQAAKADPDNLLLNLCAAQSLIMYMDEQLGWDQGYVNRARRYMARGRKLDAEDILLQHLEVALQQLEAAHGAYPTRGRSVAAGTAPPSAENPN